ncbi:MAG: AmmeMemoRadiSam system radical SAM enzyme [Elusimicrobia bacterium]|nr:AmmeMemoRadiSam system radical SAM enzyme [Elusimicrobiota bacterium]
MIIECELCPKGCRIPEGKSGDCRARVNLDGRLISVNYARPCAVHIDPIEKKPLAHYLPGTPVFSLAAAGCNLHCKNCQNWQISQSPAWETSNYVLEPGELVRMAAEKGCPSIAYTYTEPSIYYEYVFDTAGLARDRGIKNVMVTAGYLNPIPTRKLYSLIDASNTDLKSFDDRFYREICDATLAPVLENLTIQRELGVWVEVTNLVIPTLNDDMKLIRKMCSWIKNNLGDYTPLHFSRFNPMYKLRNLPPTPAETLYNARKEAMDAGLKYVYIGNILSNEAESTFCPSCGNAVIGRTGYRINSIKIKDSKCTYCGEKIEGVWKR